VDLDEILYGDDGIEYCLLQAYVGKVDTLVLPRTYCSKLCFPTINVSKNISGNGEKLRNDSFS
jgi:hypothetical protein